MENLNYKNERVEILFCTPEEKALFKEMQTAEFKSAPTKQEIESCLEKEALKKDLKKARFLLALCTTVQGFLLYKTIQKND